METITRYEMRDELQRVLQSRGFAKAQKKRRFLEFVCEQTLAGNAEQLTEHLIGREIYGRGPDFDPQADAIVRVQAYEIRKALKQYYSEEAAASLWRIDLPPGHYVPTFTRSAESPAEATPAEAVPGPAKPPRQVGRNLLLAILSVTTLLFCALWLRERAAAPPAPSRLPESAEWFWKPFLPPAQPPIISIPNHPLLRAAHDGDSPATLKRGHIIPKGEIPEFRDTIHFRELEGFYFVPSLADFTSVGEALGLVSLYDFLSGTGQKPRVTAARLVNLDAVKKTNAILLGGNQSWSGRVFLYPEGFWFHNGVISNKTPRPGEQAVYKAEFDPVTNNLTRDYALVLMLPNASRSQRILLVYGIYTQGTQAALEYLTSPEKLQELRGRLTALSPDRRRPPDFFQVLLTTTVENSVPGEASYVSARVVPN